jgi:hypothetical protein
MFIKEEGDWQGYKNLPDMMEVDLHFGRGEPGSFMDNMGEVSELVKRALRDAQECGFQFIMFRHGHSTSRPGQTTARSFVRGIMRSKESTPFIIKSRSVQHDSVFIAAVRPKEVKVTKFVVRHGEKEFKLWKTTADSYVGQNHLRAEPLENEEEVFYFFGEERLAQELYSSAGLELVLTPGQPLD